MASDRRAGNSDPTVDRSLRIQIEEARMAAFYIERASTWAGDIDQDIATELMALHRRMLERIRALDRFQPP
jgi:hypothetical protein